jgi:GNAT superfamily N-acetyltransferase
MKRTSKSALRKSLRHLFGLLPKSVRFRIFRAMIECDPAPDARLQLKIADTREELEACFRILHDAYVASGFMKPDPSGMRVTIYHALPTTTTLCAKFEGQVVGTISIIREGVFGFPLQSAFDLAAVRQKDGQVAEISALAVHPSFRKTGGVILFPLMKFLYEYCRTFFDTRHMVIAVNPNRIEMYESLLFFERLAATVVDRYDFANGAPAVGATLDLQTAPEILGRAYSQKTDRKNLYKYFVDTRLANIELPRRKYHTTNDPVMTPDLLDHFFNRATSIFATLDERKKRLLHSIYDLREYQRVLPPLVARGEPMHALRQHQRYSLKCPGVLDWGLPDSGRTNPGAATRGSFALQVIEVSMQGFKARCEKPIPMRVAGRATIELGHHERSVMDAVAVRIETSEVGTFYGFRVDTPDAAWRRCVTALQQGTTHGDLGS